jgi:hypothetical protein
MMNAKQHQGGEGLKDLGADEAKAMLTTGSGDDSGAGVGDDQEGGTTGATSMTGGDYAGARSPEASGSAASPAGREGGAAAPDQGDIGTSSARPGPMGAGGGGHAGGSGSMGTGTYNQAGNVTGPDSPGSGAAGGAAGEGQGDDLANRLGGGEGSRSGVTGSAAVSGDMRAGRSEMTSRPAAAGYTPDAGAPGGMGGVRGSGKSPGGVSPILKEEEGGPGQ